MLVSVLFAMFAATGKAMPLFDRTPDKPRSFGYKTLWFAVRASDPASVVDALEFGQASPANWASGLAAASPHGGSPEPGSWVFVSPPIDGWVLAVSAAFPYPVTIDAHPDIGGKFDVVLSRLMNRFDDVQFFGSHRVVGFVTWARARAGEPTRIFGFADGEVLANFGEQTAEEARLGFVDLSGMSPSDACDEIFAAAGRDAIPDESDVVDLAALWSVDPTQLEDRDHPLGSGLAVRLPDELTQ